MITITFAITAAALAGQAQAEPKKANEPVVQCVVVKVEAHYRDPDLALNLSNWIALSCAELLRQPGSMNCGANQSTCERLMRESNDEMTIKLQRLAYELIVLRR